MNGYEFTRFEADFTAKVKAQHYDVVEVQRSIVARANTDLRKTADYDDAKDWFIDTTMSCTQREAISWMNYYMANAIAYGIQTKNLDWRTKFLAAYDLFIELTA